MNKLILSKEFFIARGGERDCYSHPLDNTKVIKILYEINGIYAYNGSRNDIEYKYFQFLEKLKIPFTHIAKCYGYVDTNLGKGLISDKVYDYDGNTSASFLNAIIQSKFTENMEHKLVEDLKNYIFKNDILFIDCELDNILCCEYEQGKYKLIIIDGLGAKRKGLKFWLYLNSKIYTKYKIRVQWKKFINKINKLNNGNKIENK